MKKYSDVKVYEGLKFGNMTVLGLNEGKTNRNINRQKTYDVMCVCGKMKIMREDVIRKYIKSDNIVNCGRCNSYTFEDWCNDNNTEYLELWDYERNIYKPNDISCNTVKKYFFKSKKEIYKIDYLSIVDIIKAEKASIINKAKVCNSFGKYLIDMYGENAIEKYWSDKNILDPFETSKSSCKKVYIICDKCKNEFEIKINSFTKRNRPCSICSDGIPYTEKFFTSMLNHLNIRFESQFRRDWTDRKIYDFYLNDYNCIVETHGKQHYVESFGKNHERSRNLEEEKNNDALKDKLARENGIEHYIQLDCRKSELEWIKISIMNSELPKILNFKEEDIDWLECHKFACNSMVKEVCYLWMTRQFKTTTELGKYIGLGRATTRKYLKQGSELEWCDYNPEAECIRSAVSTGKGNGKMVSILKDGVILGTFDSCAELERKSEKLFGVKLAQSRVSDVCSGKFRSYKKFTFKYVT